MTQCNSLACKGSSIFRTQNFTPSEKMFGKLCLIKVISLTGDKRKSYLSLVTNPT